MAFMALALASVFSAQALFAAQVKTGLDTLVESNFSLLSGKKIGLITNHTGKDRQGRGAVELLALAPGVELRAVFSPEHGFMGASEENVVDSDTIRLGGKDIPVYSLYRGGMAGMRPTPEQLAGLDALVFDIQDIGARFYTYLASMAMGLEEAKKAGIEFIVLDRPNPINGIALEGPVLEDISLRQVTPTAYFAVPVRHGMTAGEIALLHNAEVQHPRLHVVKLEGWRRELWYDEIGLPWIPPSPNMPDLEAATLYPGIGLFEASNISVGRGTPLPFRWVGAPWMNGDRIVKRLRKAQRRGALPGIEFEVQNYTPSKNVHQDKACSGVRMRVTDRLRLRPLEVFRQLHQALRATHPKDFAWKWGEARKMTGSDRFETLCRQGCSDSALERLFERGLPEFAARRRPFLLYE
ncbi:MAG: DUF1343 domain-containing protein [Elusimicrobia bacterium]|nr:DUF1343 domain-containing protein [Elusimicrobiota bacterium]